MAKNYLAIPLFVFLLLSTSAFANNVILYNTQSGLYIGYNNLINGVVFESSPNTNYNGYTWLQIQEGQGQQMRSYMEFNLSSLNGTNISHVDLGLFDYAGSFSTTMSTWNTTNNWNRTNITWNNMPSLSQRLNNTPTIAVGEPGHTGAADIYADVTSAVISALNNGYVSLVILSNLTNTTNLTYASQFYRSGSTPFLNITYTTSSGCTNPVIGSYCTPDASGIITSKDYNCNNNVLTSCPEGDKCDQISYSQNTTSVITNITDCSACILVFIARSDNIVWSPNCKYVSQDYIKSCDCGNWYCSQHIYNSTLNQTFTINEWKAGCWNPLIQDFDLIIDENGNNTTINNITNSYCPGCVPIIPSTNYTYCPNTTTTCYDSQCKLISCNTSPIQATSLYGSLALGFGSIFGLSDPIYLDVDIAMFSIMLSLIISIALLYFSRRGDVFAYSFLGALSMFTIGMGNIYLWLIFAILIVITAGIMTGAFKKMIGGG